MQTSQFEHSAHPLRASQIRGILLLLGILVVALLYNAIATRPAELDPALQHAQITYEQEKLRYNQEKLRVQQETLRRNDRLKFYSAISLIGVINLSLLIIAGSIARAKMRTASVYTAQIGDHSIIPVRYKDLQRFYPIAVNLSLAELEASISNSHDKAYQISRQMLQDVTNYTRAFAGKRELFPGKPAVLGFGQTVLSTPTLLSTPGFAELLRNGTLAPGKPLIIGYTQGQPQYRELQDLKSVAVAGWQGSGKTLSMAYLIASSVLAYGVQVYVIDPHRQHQESLASVIHPLETTGLVTVVNPFDTPTIVKLLNQVLDRRLSRQDPNTPGILLVIDELARLAKMSCFDELVRFLERCTEETRKAKITFLGSSPKWTARHFKGRADIRSCMNSMLIHKTKPSQADLLLEDAQDKKLVKQLQRPGEAILVTDYAPPVIVTMPYCCRQDMETVATMIGTKAKGYKAARSQGRKGGASQRAEKKKEDQKLRRTEEQKGTEIPLLEEPVPSKAAGLSKGARSGLSDPGGISDNSPVIHGWGNSDIISLAQHRQKHQSITDPVHLTVEKIKEQIQYHKRQEPGLTQADIARWAEISPSTLSKILNGHTVLTEEHQQKLFEVLFEPEMLEGMKAARIG